MGLLIEAGADVNAREEFSTAFRAAQKKHMRSFDGKVLVLLAGSDSLCFLKMCLYLKQNSQVNNMKNASLWDQQVFLISTLAPILNLLNGLLYCA